MAIICCAISIVFLTPNSYHRKHDARSNLIINNCSRYYKTLFTILAILTPMFIPFVFWGETLWNGFFVCFLFRLVTTLNLTWLVNSAAHMYGNKPFTE